MNATKRDGARMHHKSQSQPLTKAQALELLQSAMHYCQSAGLTVQCKIDSDFKGFVLYLPEVQSVNTPEGLRFTLAEGETA